MHPEQRADSVVVILVLVEEYRLDLFSASYDSLCLY
jgi:hypothetical protein